MTHKLRWLSLAGLMALLAASAAACGADDDEPTEEVTRCTDVDCGTDPNVTCDPEDGVCKCGGPGGKACLDGQACVVDPSPTCVSDLCELTTCENGESCDPSDGLCKCGSDSCGEGEQCVDNSCVAADLCTGVTCGGGESCDPADGLCKCGTGDDAVVCSFGQACEEGSCIDDPCAGVNCGEGTTCNPDDGLCHCGGENGPVCTTGQACVIDGDSGTCEGESLCADASTRCLGGTVCDPNDGACRCGGVGPTFPQCGSDQTCDASIDQCLGGDQCSNVECSNGNSCDPENGACRCGGLGGITCADTELCVALNDAATCASPCSPLDGSSCGEGEGCYFDASQRELGAFCAATDANPSGIGGPCQGANECEAGLHCMAGEETGACRAFCDTTSETPCADALQVCVPIPGGGLEDTGVCLSVNI